MPFDFPLPCNRVDVPDGLGVIDFDAGVGRVTLKLAGDPIARDWDERGGSIMWLARRIAPQPDDEPLHRPEAWAEPAEWDVLRQWVRHVEPEDDPVVPLRPLLGLLASGRYGVGLGTLPNAHVRAVKTGKEARWYADSSIPFFGHTIIPTHHWPPPDKAAVAAYREQIADARAQPALILVTHPESEAYYLLDGHHKLAAYLALERDPVCVVIEAYTARRDYLSYLEEPSEEYRFSENESGTGVLHVVGRDGASALRIGGKPCLVEGYTGSGTADRLAVRSGDPWVRRKVRRLRAALREPAQASALEMSRALWPLLAPGRYGLRRWVPGTYYVEAVQPERIKSWYVGITTPDLGAVLLPTDQWPPRDAATVADYCRRIKRGERPLVVTLRAAPPEDEDDAVAFVVDGHHKLAAYQRLGVAPHCLDIARVSEETACDPADLDAVAGEDPVLREATARLLAYLRKPAGR
ncbi:hypothetical protein [Glycomyces tritici]|uniref:ParB/Sulfiredoxin domain-containing protein n=1 Tax=Glycomyces tritici TaxID=2665176 RepID=A0ABT7YRP6_9ACTN|nr:hypothetical protein [Glycomyces tritici]MDN3241318.1 hypothetical protein [Glycomyces tritici]MDN3243341.1 hypothetical protein [Glycomyces tritici]